MHTNGTFQRSGPGMKAWAQLLAAAVMGVLLLVACARTGKLAPLPPDAVILAFGDSITYGTGATPGESYPAQLEKLAGRTVINAGVPGEVSAEGLGRLPAVLDKERPALMLLCLGGNDFLRKLDERLTAEHIGAMVRLAKERGVAVVLIGVPKPGLLPSAPPFYREIAKEMKVPCDDEVLKKILTDSALKADYIHPNGAGYKVLAEAVLDLLKKSGAL